MNMMTCNIKTDYVKCLVVVLWVLELSLASHVDATNNLTLEVVNTQGEQLRHTDILVSIVHNDKNDKAVVLDALLQTDAQGQLTIPAPPVLSGLMLYLDIREYERHTVDLSNLSSSIVPITMSRIASVHLSAIQTSGTWEDKGNMRLHLYAGRTERFDGWLRYASFIPPGSGSTHYRLEVADDVALQFDTKPLSRERPIIDRDPESLKKDVVIQLLGLRGQLQPEGLAYFHSQGGPGTRQIAKYGPQGFLLPITFPYDRQAGQFTDVRLGLCYPHSRHATVTVQPRQASISSVNLTPLSPIVMAVLSANWESTGDYFVTAVEALLPLWERYSDRLYVGIGKRGKFEQVAYGQHQDLGNTHLPRTTSLQVTEEIAQAENVLAQLGNKGADRTCQTSAPLRLVYLGDPGHATSRGLAGVKRYVITEKPPRTEWDKDQWLITPDNANAIQQALQNIMNQ